MESARATHSLQPNFSSIFFAKSEYAGAALSCIWLAIAVFVFFVNMFANAHTAPAGTRFAERRASP